jgi:DNA-binding beta-propeller fold protein YncE
MKPAPPVTSTRSATRLSLRVGAGRDDGLAAAPRVRPLLGARRARGLVAAAALALVVAVAGCGGSSSSSSTAVPGPRRAAEPAESPPLRAAPAGRSAAVGREPEGVAWDAAAGLVAVGVRAPAALAFVDPASLRVVRRVPLPGAPRHLAPDPGERAVLVPAESADELAIARPGGVLTATKVGTHPHDAAAVGGEVFVADEHSDQISVLRHAHLVRTLHTPHQPGGIAGVAGRWVALVAVSARVLAVYDARSLKRVATLPAGVGPSHIVARGTTAYVADTQGDRILVYAIGPHPRLLGKVPAPGTPYGLALDPRRDRLWVTETASDRLAEFSLRGKLPRPLATYPTLRQPNSVAVDPGDGAVFVAGRDAGRIERIVPARGGDR